MIDGPGIDELLANNADFVEGFDVGHLDVRQEMRKRRRAAMAASITPAVISWTGKRRNDSTSLTACSWGSGSGRLSRVAWT